MGIHVLIRSFRIYVHNNSDIMFKSNANAFSIFIIYVILLPAASNFH